MHKLEDFTSGEVFDGRTEVNRRISELVGMGSATFLRTVVLPQGRFQELLVASEADRSASLRHILGLDDLAVIRSMVHDKMTGIEPLLTELRVRRARLLDDPVAELEEQGARLAVATKAHDRLRSTRDVVRDLRNCNDERAERALRIDAELARLRTRVPNRVVDDYAHLLAEEYRLDIELKELDTALAQGVARVSELQRKLDVADADGAGITATSRALSTLASLVEELPELASEGVRLDESRKRVEANKAALAKEAIELIELGDVLADAESGLGTARQEHDRLNQRLTMCAGALADVRRAENRVCGIVSEVEDAEAAERQSRALVATVEENQRRARRQVELATTDLRTAQRAHAAAHASAECGPGDCCPICDRSLPADFRPAAPPELEAAEKAVKVANREAVRLESTYVTAEREHSAAAVHLAIAQQEAEAARTELAEAAADLRALVGIANLGSTDEEILTEPTEAARSAAEAFTSAESTFTLTNQAHIEKRAAHTQAKHSVAQQEETLASEVERFHIRDERAKRNLHALPATFLGGAEPVPEHLIATQKRAQERLKELDAIQRQLARDRAGVDEVRRQRSKLDCDRAEKVTAPAGALRLSITSLVAEVATATRLVGLDVAFLDCPTGSIANDARWAADAVERCTDVIRRGEGQVEALRRENAANNVAAAKVLAEAELEGDVELDAALQTAVTDQVVAKLACDRARREAPLCRDLDRRILAADPVVKSLRELHALLSDGKFPAMVIRHRQRTLLAVASDLLSDMSRQRYAFSDDFRILDCSTGQPRAVKTLSGGETFLASLALALALVELTARGGAKVEALFLDEGFGTLDADALGDALEALGRQAADGRLVAVISHMRDVAVNFQHVLRVTYDIAGSRATWLSQDERERMITEEMGAGLLG